MRIVAILTLLLLIAQQLVCAASFPCSVVAPAVEAPANATQVHPAHISVVMAIGDSISAAFAARDFLTDRQGLESSVQDAPFEFRGLSFSGGKGDDSSWTLPYFLRQYNSALEGFSSQRTIPQTPESGYLEKDTDFLNAALSNAHSFQLDMQLDELVAQSQRVADFDRRWKLLTVLIGANDLCDGLVSGFEACGEEMNDQLVFRYESNLRSALGRIRDSFGNIVVQVVSLFSLASVKRVRSGHTWCDLRPKLMVECHCLDTSMFGDGVVSEEQLDRFDATVAAFNDRIHTVAQEFNLQRPDFAVIEVVTGKNQVIPHISYLSSLDCFHPSAHAHATFATAIWNSLFDDHRSPVALNDSVPLFCPNADSLIRIDGIERLVV